MSNESRHYQGVAAHHDKLAEHGVYGLLAPQNRGGGKSRYVTAVFDEALLPLIRENRFPSLLDFGCGTGTFCYRIADVVGSVTGVEISSKALELAKEVCKSLSNVSLLLTNGDDLPSPDASFDCVVAREALMYVPDSKLERVFREIYRVLRPGGYFLVLDQVSEDPHWQRYPGTPLQLKRAPAEFEAAATSVGFTFQQEHVVRTPRFPAVYLAWSGLVPPVFIPGLARFEVEWHRQRPRPVKRWWNSLFVFAKPR